MPDRPADTHAAAQEIPFGARVRVADVADMLLDLGHQRTADALIDAVRCCEHFPECSHMLAYIEEIHGV